MFFGEPQQHFLEPRFHLLDPEGQVAGFSGGLGCARVDPEQERIFAGQLALQFGPPTLRQRHRLASVGQPAHLSLQALEVVAAFARHHADVFLLELGQAVFGFRQAPFQLADFVAEKALCGFLAGAFAAQRLFDERIEQRLDHREALLAAVVLEADGVETVGGRISLAHLRDHEDALLQGGEQTLARFRGLGAQIEVGLASNGFQRGPAEQRLAHDRELRFHIGIERQTAQQRAKDGFGIDVDARLRLVHVRHGKHVHPADQACGPGGREPQPAEAPAAADVVQYLDDQGLHKRASRELAF